MEVVEQYLILKLQWWPPHLESKWAMTSQPSIPDAIDELIADGADDITVLSYFLSAGRHVREDVPAFVEAKRTQYPEVKLSLSPYLGQAPDLIEVLHRLAKT